MFRVQASTLEAYFAADPARESDLRAADSLIRAAAPGLARGVSAARRPAVRGCR
ncbi:hypothetical protein [Fodinicola feengrottensis]|uniref:Type II toxin-antitoxin system RelE/ParE family toxin n=1 Tax=Fodinicola feengrottensis TaxID=435914 RepID=A0ABP4V370_9ACTN|nr:hypothetical protein [Fodinicola feengrottensis]